MSRKYKRTRREIGKASQQLGKDGEVWAENRLRALGLEMVEKIGTPVRLIPIPEWMVKMFRKWDANAANIYRVIFGEKVSGDRRAIIPGSGISVLIETKTVMNRKLSMSDFKPHQPGRLTRHQELGGLSLVVWIHESNVYILEWPIPGFKKGKPLDPDRAMELCLQELRDAKRI